MTTPGDRVVAAAARRVGTTERPLGSNGDGGGWIDQIIRAAGLYDLPGPEKPWCNMATMAWYREPGVSDQGIQSPSTALTAANARRLGLVTGHPARGGLVCWPGRHIALIETVYAGGVVGTIGGNESDAVRRSTRNGPGTGAIFITPSAMAAPPPPAPTRVWCFNDPKGRVLHPGAWRTKAFALAARRRLGAIGTGAVLTRRNRRWRILLPAEWRFANRPARDTWKAKREKQTGRRMRTSTRLVAHLTPAQAAAQGLGKTT